MRKNWPKTDYGKEIVASTSTTQRNATSTTDCGGSWCGGGGGLATPGSETAHKAVLCSMITSINAPEHYRKQLHSFSGAYTSPNDNSMACFLFAGGFQRCVRRNSSRIQARSTDFRKTAEFNNPVGALWTEGTWKKKECPEFRNAKMRWDPTME